LTEERNDKIDEASSPTNASEIAVSRMQQGSACREVIGSNASESLGVSGRKIHGRKRDEIFDSWMTLSSSSIVRKGEKKQ